VANQTTRGYVMQLSTVASAANVGSALAMSALAIRFRHKALFMIGLALSITASSGILLAPDFLWMMVFFVIGGIAGPMVAIMAITLLGDFMTQKRKAKTLGYLIATVYVGSLVGNVALYFLSRGGFFADPGTWRFAFLMLDLPFTVVAFVVAFFGISSKLQKPHLAVGKETYVRSYKAILLNKSAAACLVGSLLFSGAIGLLVINFYQGQFEFSLQNTSLLLMVSLALFAAGSFFAGQLANRIGAKKLTMIGALGDGIFIVLLFFAPNLWMSLAFNWAHVWFASTAATALAVLAIDQVPMARGTMMSMRGMFANIGNSMSPAIGGAMLVLFSQASTDFPGLGFQVAGIVLGAMSIAAAAIILFMVKDPTRTLLREEKKAEIR